MALSFVILFVTTSAHAGGNRIMSQSGSAAGQSAAFTAQADDPSAVYYNPAGMTQLESVQISLGMILLTGETDFTNFSGDTTTGNFDGDVLWPPLVQFYLTANLPDLGLTALGDLSLGFGVLSPFGTKYNWPNDGPFNTALTFAAFELIDFKPTVAYKLNAQLSFGVGLDIYTFLDFYGDGQFREKFNASGTGFTAGIPAGTPMDINGDDTALGFNLSLLYTPFRNDDGKPLANVSIVYRSGATMRLKGELLANGAEIFDAETKIVLPQVITGAVAIWPVRDREREWKLELDVDYTGWESIDDLDVELSNGVTIPFPTDWRGSFTVMLGTEYKWLATTLLPDWDIALRGGYWFSQTPVPDKGFTPAIPDADNHSISVGLGMHCKGNGRFLGVFQCGRPVGASKWRPKAVVLDLAFQVLLYEDRKVTGSRNVLASPPNAIDGHYETIYYAGALNLTMKW
jgi:long-chain fatty acid transport protein